MDEPQHTFGDSPAACVPGGPPAYYLGARAKFDEARQAYTAEEDSVPCGRFPHMAVCACDVNCKQAIEDIQLFEVYPNICMGPF